MDDVKKHVNHMTTSWCIYSALMCYKSKFLELDREVTLYRVYTGEFYGKLYTE